MPSLLAMAPGVMAIARREATPARLWRRLPYTTKTLIGVWFDEFVFFVLLEHLFFVPVHVF